MGMIIKVTLEVTTDSSDWDPPEDAPTIRREMILSQGHTQPLNYVADVKTQFAKLLREAVNEIVNA